MTIPKKFQIFDTKVNLPDKDAERLTPYLSGWPVLSKWFYSARVNEPDLQRLIVMELMGSRRHVILMRLAARLGSLSRWKVKAKIEGLL